MPMASYTVTGYYKPKAQGKYPWPCEAEPDRTIELFVDDVLTKDPDGTYCTHTGLMCFRIQLTDDQVEFHPGTARLVGM